MITAIRRSFKSKAYKIILWITILALAGLFTLPELLKIGSKAAWFAKANSTMISRSDYMRKVLLHEERINALRAQFGPQADIFLQSMGMSLNPKVFAKDAVIQDALLDSVAQQMGLRVSDAYVAEKLANPLFVRQELMDIIPLGAFDQTGNIDPRILQHYFQRMGLSMADFEQIVGRILARRMLLDLLQVNLGVPEILVHHQFGVDHARKKFSILTLSFDKMLQNEKKNAISDADLKAYFDAQNEQSKKYWVPEKRNGNVWRVHPKNYDIQVSEHEIEDYYENNKMRLYVAEPAQVHVRHIFIKAETPADRHAASEKAQRIRQEALAKPKEFALIASKESDDKSQVERGGLLAWFKRGEKEPAFDKAAFTLKENGDISEVIPTAQGFEIIQRMDKKPTTYKALATVRKDIIDVLTDQKFAEQFARDMRGVIEGARNIEGGLEKALEAKSFKAEKIAQIVQDDKDWGRTLFGLHNTHDADAYLDKGVGMVVQVTEIQKPYLPSFDSIKGTLAHDMHEKNARAHMKEAVRAAFEKAKSSDLSSLKNEFNGSLTTTSWVSKSDTSSVADLRKKGIPVEQLFQLEKMGGLGFAESESEGFVFKLDEVESVDPKTAEKQKNETRDSLVQEQNRLFTAGFVASLFRSAKIEFSQSSNESEYSIAYED